MALEILGRERLGRVVVKDDRDDGTIIFLVCEETDLGKHGVVASPDEENGDGEWPTGEALLSTLTDRHVATSRFTLTLNTTNMPARVLEFDMDQFVRMAVNSAEHGTTAVELNEDNAAEWGYRRGDQDDGYPSP